MAGTVVFKTLTKHVARLKFEKYLLLPDRFMLSFKNVIWHAVKVFGFKNR